MIIEATPKDLMIAKYFNLEEKMIVLKLRYEEEALKKLTLSPELELSDVQHHIDQMKIINNLITEVKRLRDNL